jgi:hypothetical protein
MPFLSLTCPTDRGKDGTKRSLLTDGAAFPSASRLTARIATTTSSWLACPCFVCKVGDMATNPPGVRVFISSTYLDNELRRGLVRDAIERAGMIAVGMETFEASMKMWWSCSLQVWPTDGSRLAVPRLGIVAPGRIAPWASTSCCTWSRRSSKSFIACDVICKGDPLKGDLSTGMAGGDGGRQTQWR